MAKTLKGGHRVLFADDERLDIPDTIALPELAYDYLNEVSAMLGAGQGTSTDGGLPVGGTLCDLVFDTTTPSATAIYGPGGTSADKAVFSMSYAVGAGEYEHHVLTYDPSASGQQTTVDLSVWADGTTPYIWARRIDVNQDVDTRRKWDTVGNAEILFSQATREGYRIEFSVTANTTAPSGDARWCCIAQVTSISGTSTVFTFGLIHPFDLGSKPDTGANYWGSLLPAATGTDYRYLGVAGAMYQLKSLIDTEASQRAGADSVIDAALVIVAGDVATNTAGVAANVTALNNFGLFVTHAVRVQANGAGGWAIVKEEAPAAGGATLTVVNAWTFKLNFPFGPANHVQASVSATDSNFPGDYLVQATLNSSFSPLGQELTVFVQTLENLIDITSYNWDAPPTGNPGTRTLIHILAGA